MRLAYLCVVLVNLAWATPDLPFDRDAQPTPTTSSRNFLTQIAKPTPFLNLNFLTRFAPASQFTRSSFVTQVRQATSTAPCELVSSASHSQRIAAPSAIPTVPAQLAYDCLNSVPLNTTAAIQLVDSIVPYVEWQSSLSWLKNPPTDYDFPPHDPLANLASVREKLVQDKYSNEQAFQVDLYNVFTPAHDGHFVFFPDLLSRAFDFNRLQSLVSISEDGQSPPVIKVYEDVIRSPKDASIVTQINGIDALEFLLNDVKSTSGQQVLDAGYNALFFTKASFALGLGNGHFSSGGRGRFLFQGPTTTLTFSNGTSTTFENFARIRGNFQGVDSGASFYLRFCDPNRNLNAPPNPRAPLPTSPLVPGYPPAIIKTNGTEVSGYYLSGDGFEDVAVMSVLTFESRSPPEYQQVVESFIRLAKRDGKKKLVIDLSQNGGGLIFLGYDLFRQFFPDIVQDGNSRWRANDNFLAVAEIFSRLARNFDPNSASDTLVVQANVVFNYREDLNISDQPFRSFERKFGPLPLRDDKFTNLMRWNLSDPILTTNTTFGLGTDVTGYGSRTNFTQPFEAEDIILLYDGICASTCTIFSQFMRELGGVKSIAVGGRPIDGPIEGVGGVKGSQILLWNDIYQYANSALADAGASEAEQLRRLTTLPLSRSGAAGSNVRDAILKSNIDDGTPSQFIREISDCRLYFTEPMINDVTALWKAAADAAFNGKQCPFGSLPQRSKKLTAESFSPGFMIESTEFATATDVFPDQNDAWLAVHNQKAIN